MEISKTIKKFQSFRKYNGDIGKECDQICLTCKRNLVVTSKNYAGCPMMCGKLTQEFTIKKDKTDNENNV